MSNYQQTEKCLQKRHGKRTKIYPESWKNRFGERPAQWALPTPALQVETWTSQDFGTSPNCEDEMPELKNFNQM